LRYLAAKHVVVSAGLLMYRRKNRSLEVLLAHPGGPLFRNKDAGAWTIPKGLPNPGEDLLAAAIREFAEETGLTSSGPWQELGQVKQKSGKLVHAWAFEADLPPAFVLTSNTFELAWPPRSGRTQQFPEVDRVEFFELAAARGKINPAQVALLDRLEKHLSSAEH